MKPIANLLPFVVLGPSGILRELRRLGFQTFDDVIDEGYDDLTDPAQRFAAASAEALRLASISHKELRRLYIRVWPRLVFNLNHFLSVSPLLVDKDEAFLFMSGK